MVQSASKTATPSGSRSMADASHAGSMWPAAGCVTATPPSRSGASHGRGRGQRLPARAFGGRIRRDLRGDRMPVQLNHTIVAARDRWESARFLAGLLGRPEPTPYGPFAVVELDN